MAGDLSWIRLALPSLPFVLLWAGPPAPAIVFPRALARVPASPGLPYLRHCLKSAGLADDTFTVSFNPAILERAFLPVSVSFSPGAAPPALTAGMKGASLWGAPVPPVRSAGPAGGPGS